MLEFPRTKHGADGQVVRLPRLLALHPVVCQAHWHLRNEVERFYGDLLGLGSPLSQIESSGTLLLVFHNDGPDLLIRLTDQPEVWANRPRLVLEVPDLEAIRSRLQDECIEYQTLQGWSWPDQRLGLWDPSGNRLEIKRLWGAF